MTPLGLDLGSETSYAITDGIQQASSRFAGYNVRKVHDLVPVDAALTVSSDIRLPADAEIDQATFTVSAAPAANATVSSVAEVREAEPPGGGRSAATIDFGRLVTASALFVPGDVLALWKWNGTAFEFLMEGDGGFAEVSTERLLAEFSDAVDVDELRDSASVSLPAVPSGLELLVDGTTVWFERQGGSAGIEPPEVSGQGTGFGIDRTDAVREAFGRRRGEPVRVEVRASTPGSLALGHTISHHRVHQVAFPEGTTRSVDIAEEGPFGIELPLPADSTGWQIDEVRVTLRGSLGDTRILPAEGPPLADDALVVLGRGRTVVAALPTGLLDRFHTVAAVRLPLRSSDGDSEVAGRLLADVAGRPGDVVRGGDLAPVRLAASDVAAWSTLATKAAVPVAGTLWLELSIDYGEVEWMLTGNSEADLVAPGAVLYRRLAGGGVRPFPTLVDLGPRLGAVRLVGGAPPNQPIPALVLDLGTGAPVEVTPGTADARAVVGLPTPLQPEAPSTTLDALARATGSVTLTDVRVVYQEPEDREEP